ncbi:MAG: Vi polysaccharide biosynthesis UDP-N-acetylglucosamine C-6 dehydrogenase TviB, partial [Xanthomonadaceae bacterium]|nr:Vi polysaccharide biosynthesis UDP-N-acetylglucosamine C-6 dehydrogenase TviB [Xanthomonadaceae bacterium]
MIKTNEIKIAIIGLGYVGLPLALEFSKKFETIGFDINQTRIAELKSGHDRTRESDASELGGEINLVFTSDPAEIADANT